MQTVKLYAQVKPERQPDKEKDRKTLWRSRSLNKAHYQCIERMFVKCVACPRNERKHLQYDPYIQPVKALYKLKYTEQQDSQCTYNVTLRRVRETI